MKYIKNIFKKRILATTITILMLTVSVAEAANVTTLQGLQTALAGTDTEITIKADITTTAPIVIARPVSITAQGNKTISFIGDTAGWQGNYVLQIGDTAGVTLGNLKLTGGDAAVLVNNSTVTVVGHMTVTGNEFGGIKVVQSEGGNPPSLIVNANAVTNTLEAYGFPTVWEEGVTDSVSMPSATVRSTIAANQVHYYLRANNAVTEQIVSTANDFLAAVANVNVSKIELAANFTLSEQVAIDRALTIKGKDKTISAGDGMTGALLMIYGDNVSIENLIIDGTHQNIHGIVAYKASGVTLSNVSLINNDKAGLVVNGSEVSVSNITTADNAWGGINVDQGVGVTTPSTLTVTGISIHTETGADLWRDDNAKTDVSIVDTGNQYASAEYVHSGITGTKYYLGSVPNTDKAITSFITPSGTGMITGTTILLTVPFGTDITALTPTIVHTGASIMPQSNVAQNFSMPILYTVTAADGTTENYSVAVSVLGIAQMSPSVDGQATITATASEVVISNPTQAVTITIDSEVSAPKIDASSFITNGTGTLPEISISAEMVGTGTVTVGIPASTTVTSSDANWDGIINLPTVKSNESVDLIAGARQTATVSFVIDVGSEMSLTFNKAVRLVLPGQAGKNVGFSHGSSALTEIARICSEDSQAMGDALDAAAECKMDNGSDLIVWTKHFTSFATYTIATRGSSHRKRAVAANTIDTLVPTAPSAGLVGAVLGAEKYLFSTLIKQGSRGNEVAEFQKFLTVAGYNTGIADGIFGPKTKTAIVKFQIAHGLKGDGIVGPLTRAVLNK